jgi:AraC-like DNA-binding protein
VTEPPLEPTVAWELISPVFRAVRELGHPEAALWDAAGLSAVGSRGAPGARFPVGEAHALWTAAVRLTGDPGVGLVAAALGEQGDMDLLDYVVRSSPTLRLAIETVRRYWRLAHDAAWLTLEPHRGRLVCEAHVTEGLDVPPAFVEWGIGAWARTTREVFGPVRYHEIHFRHAPETEVARYETFFGCPVRFLAPKDALFMPEDVLDHVNPAADPRLVGVLERYADARLREIPERPTLSGRVKVLLREALGAGDPSLAAVAKQLRMSERTLRRRLEAEGTGHRELLDAVRRELALRHLGEEQLSVEETSYRLGYESPSGLHRAFKRWTGFSPLEYRNRYTGS